MEQTTIRNRLMKVYLWEHDPTFDDDKYSSERLMSQMNAILDRDYRLWNHATMQALKCRDEAEHGKEIKF